MVFELAVVRAVRGEPDAEEDEDEDCGAGDDSEKEVVVEEVVEVGVEGVHGVWSCLWRDVLRWFGGRLTVSKRVRQDVYSFSKWHVVAPNGSGRCGRWQPPVK